MQIKNQFEHKLISKAIKRYKYDEEIDQKETEQGFYDRYLFYTKGKKFKKSLNIFYNVLSGTPRCDHIAAKNLLFQGKSECWKFFERTAQFNAYYYAGGSFPFIDPVAALLNFALYVERMDLIELLLSKANSDLDREEYKSNRDYIKQEVYPSTYLIHFLIEKSIKVTGGDTVDITSEKKFTATAKEDFKISTEKKLDTSASETIEITCKDNAIKLETGSSGVEIEAKKPIKITGDDNIDITGEKDITVSSAKDLNLSSDKKLAISAESEIENSCNGSSIKLDGDIDLKAKLIKEN